MKSIDTSKIYINTFGDNYFQEINHKSFDSVGSTSTFHKLYNELLNHEKTLFVFAGSDSGLLIPYLQKYHGDKGRHYIILETPELVEYINKKIEFDPELFDIKVYDQNLEELLYEFTDYVAHDRYKLLRSLSVLDGKNETYKGVWQSVEQRFNLFKHDQIADAVSNIFIDSQIRDLALNTTPVSTIKDYLKGLTSVVLGGGPTLDENIDWIRKNQHKLIIFAAARIANRLKKENIQPDFFVSVDPNDVSYDNSKAILEFPGNPILIHSNSVNSKILAEWNGKNMYLGSMYPWKDSQHQQPDNFVVVGPTITNSMASIAAYLGSQQVLFSGVDFCQSADGSTHESQSIEASTGKYMRVTENQVKTYSGRIADTTPDFASGLDGMEDLVKFSIENFGTQFYSLSDEAAEIENVAYKPIKKIKLPNTEKTGTIDEINLKIDLDMKAYKQHLKQTKSYSQEMRNICRDTVKLSKQGKKLANKLFKNLDETDQITQQLLIIKNELDNTMGEHDEFIFTYSIAAYKNFMDPSIKEDNMEKEDIKSSFINYFSGLIQSATPLQKSIEEGIRLLNHRVNETKGTAQFDKLMEGWLKYHEEGRPRVWLKMNGLDLDTLPDEQKTKVKILLDKYEKELASTETRLSKRIKIHTFDPSFLYERMRRFFIEQRTTDISELLNYARGVETLDKDDLIHMGEGFLYELKQMPGKAVNEYAQVKDIRFLVDAMSQIVNISLAKKEYENALNALEVLTHISDEYYVAYADIVASLNQEKDAIAIYSHYLEKHDEDVATWIKLAKLLIHVDMIEDATKVIDKINELQPDNAAANELKVLIDRKH